MNNNVSEQINSVINNLAEKLGVAVDKVYPMLKAQAMIDGIWKVAIFIMFTILLFLSIKMFIKYIPTVSHKECDFGNKSDIMVIISVVIFIISIIGFAVSFCSLKDAITAIINPDWYIINNLLKDFISK